MTLCLDASVIVALFVPESRTQDALVGVAGSTLVVSDLAIAEFSSALSRRTRTGQLSAADVASLFLAFDAWIASTVQRESLEASGGPNANTLVRRLELGLRAPDALNIAIAQRCSATLFTFDQKMATAARAVGQQMVS